MLEYPPAVRKIVVAMADRAIAECLRAGISVEEFYRVLLLEQAKNQKDGTEALFSRTLRAVGVPG